MMIWALTKNIPIARTTGSLASQTRHAGQEEAALGAEEPGFTMPKSVMSVHLNK